MHNWLVSTIYVHYIHMVCVMNIPKNSHSWWFIGKFPKAQNPNVSKFRWRGDLNRTMKITIRSHSSAFYRMSTPQSSDQKKKKRAFSVSIVEDHKVRIKKQSEKLGNLSGMAKGTWNRSGKTRRSSSYLNCLTMVLDYFRCNWLNS